MAAVSRAPWRSRGELLFIAVALALYALVAAYTAWHHEPWRDEADAWLVARDASLPDLFRLTGPMGTPALWYLLLMPLAKAGLPYGVMRGLHLLVAVAAAAVLLRCAPWPRPTRALAVFSYYLLYEYAVVARSYALTMLLLFTAAALWRRRCERPLAFAGVVALLANANAFSLFPAATLGGFLAWDLRRRGRFDRRAVAALAVMLLGGLAAVAQLVPHGSPQLPGWLVLRNPQAPEVVLELLFPTPLGLALWAGDLRWLALATLAALAVAWLARPRVLVLFALPAAGMLYVFLCKWMMGERHVGLVFLLLLVALWIERLEPAAVPAWSRTASRLGWGLLHVGLAVAVTAAVDAVRFDVRHPCSHAAQVGEYLAASGLAGRPVATTVRCEAVVPYLPARRVYYADAERWGSYRTWDAADDRAWRLPSAVAAARARRALPPQRGALLLLDRPLTAPAALGYRLRYATRGLTGPSDETFFLYEPSVVP